MGDDGHGEGWENEERKKSADFGQGVLKLAVDAGLGELAAVMKRRACR